MFISACLITIIILIQMYKKKNWNDGQMLRIIMSATETLAPAIHQLLDSQEEISAQMLLIDPSWYNSSTFYFRNQGLRKEVLQTKDSLTIM